MFFTKYPHASNFVFAEGSGTAGADWTISGERFFCSFEAYADDLYRIEVQNKRRWRRPRPLLKLNGGVRSSGLGSLKPLPGGFCLVDVKGRKLLATVANAGFGVSGATSIFQFEASFESRYFGMGEKTFGRLELSGRRAKFWNTDVWGDFHFAQWLEHPTDPPYASVPYLIVRQQGVYLGLLLDNPYPAFVSTPGRPGGPEVFVEWQRTSPHLLLGSEGGQPSLWILVGPTLSALTEKLQRLVGVTPRPPLWALGYHQSRWGYGSEEDLLRLDRRFKQSQIPCDGLWLDIDYMDGFRVFTVDSEHFPTGVGATAQKLSPARRIVAILDPGVKNEPGYSIFDDGNVQGVFCRNEEGRNFVGMVWPGETVFPDFTLEKGRRWWAKHVQRVSRMGFDGFWLDMNDPSTGPVDPTAMRFAAGREPHEAHHNDYALGMQVATWRGVRAAFPSRRPFLLSRSAFTGTSRFAAVWTGDNLSNRFYLKMAIPTSLGLALSGIPFNGPDVGGFGGDSEEPLMADWMKAGFLFPFFRNHTSKDTRNQEPWAYSRRAETVLRKFIRLRYRLLPYLYQLFVRQEGAGEAILRPLFYDFDEPGLEEIDDQFLVGPWLMQAPFLDEGARTRVVRLPGAAPWFDLDTGKWRKSGSFRATNEFGTTPMFARDGSILPMRPGTPQEARHDLRRVEFHLFFRSAGAEAELRYVADDGQSTAYQRGRQSVLKVVARRTNAGLQIETEELESGFGRIRPVFILHGSKPRVWLNGHPMTLRPIRVRFSGGSLSAWRGKG